MERVGGYIRQTRTEAPTVEGNRAARGSQERNEQMWTGSTGGVKQSMNWSRRGEWAEAYMLQHGMVFLPPENIDYLGPYLSLELDGIMDHF